MAAVERGGDRQQVHEIIRRASMRATEAMKNGEPWDLIAELAAEPTFGMTRPRSAPEMKPESYIGRCRSRSRPSPPNAAASAPMQPRPAPTLPFDPFLSPSFPLHRGTRAAESCRAGFPFFHPFGHNESAIENPKTGPSRLGWACFGIKSFCQRVKCRFHIFQLAQAAHGVPRHESAAQPRILQRLDLRADLIRAIRIIRRADGVIRLNPCADNGGGWRLGLTRCGLDRPVVDRLVGMLPRAVGCRPG